MHLIDTGLSTNTGAHVKRVAQELNLYVRMVTPDSYLVVFDGVMQVLADAPAGSPSWETDNPWQAVEQFVGENADFEIDPYYNRLKVIHCPGGFLRRVNKRRLR